MTSVSIPIKLIGDDIWLILGSLTSKGVLRAVRIDKRKKQVVDWAGHHCDEVLVEGSIRDCPRGWKLV